MSGVLVALLLLVAGTSCGQASSEENPLQRRMASGNAGSGIFGTEKLSPAEMFNVTRVLQPDYQIRATLDPNNVFQFYYLLPKTGPPPTLLVSPCSGPISWSVSYIEPPENDQHAEAGTQQTHSWKVKQMVPGSPLFEYKGAEARNFTIADARDNLYLVEMKAVSSPMLDQLRTRSPNTVLLYHTSDALSLLPGNFAVPSSSSKGRRHQPVLEFQQKWSRRRLIVSWNKSSLTSRFSRVDSDQSSYLLAVTSGAHLHPPTLCAAENILKKHPCPTRAATNQQQAQQQRSEPEGLHCVRRSKITLFGLKYNTTYYFTLYIMNTRNNVSSRVAMDSFRFQRKPPITLQTGHPATVNLRNREGIAIFRYRPRDNATTQFNILACGACSARAKFRAGEYYTDRQIDGEFELRAPALPPGKRFTIQITASPADLVKMSRIKILAIDADAATFTDNSAAPRNHAWEYRAWRKCRPNSSSWCASSRTSTGAAGPCSSSPTSTSRRSPAHSLTRPCPSSP